MKAIMVCTFTHKQWNSWQWLSFLISTIMLTYNTSFVQLSYAVEPSNSIIKRWQKEGWKRTTFAKQSVNLDEIIDGGPPRDGILPIYQPKFETIEQAEKWLSDEDIVVTLPEAIHIKAYPLRILIWHEIVNDLTGQEPMIITYCPLCNSAIAFSALVNEKVHKFGVSGKLRFSDMLMWDHITESWWQQMTGEGIVGDYAGMKLKVLPSLLVNFSTFKKNFPQGKVLSMNTGLKRAYGKNPYPEYDSSTKPFLMTGVIDTRLAPMERVLGFHYKDKRFHYSLNTLGEQSWLKIKVDKEVLLILNLNRGYSVLDKTNVTDSQSVTLPSIWKLPPDLQQLEWQFHEGRLKDTTYGWTWNEYGQAWNKQALKLQMPYVQHGVYFAFAWFAFQDDSVLPTLYSATEDALNKSKNSP